MSIVHNIRNNPESAACTLGLCRHSHLHGLSKHAAMTEDINRASFAVYVQVLHEERIFQHIALNGPSLHFGSCMAPAKVLAPLMSDLQRLYQNVSRQAHLVMRLIRHIMMHKCILQKNSLLKVC